MRKSVQLFCNRWRELIFLYSLLILSSNSSLAQEHTVGLNHVNVIKTASVFQSGDERQTSGKSLLKVSGTESIFYDHPQQLSVQIGDIFPLDLYSGPETVALVSYEVLTPNAKLVAGKQALNVKPAIYKGLIGEDGWLDLSFSPQGMIGLIRWNNKTYLIQPAHSDSLPLESREQEIYEISKQNEQGLCGTDTRSLPSQIKQLMSTFNSSTLKSATINNQLTVDLAVETDYETYVSFDKDSLLTTAYLLSIISSVSQIYEREVNIKLNVVYSRVWTTPEDPYTELGFSLYPEFQNYWNTYMEDIERDAAILIIKDAGRLGGGLSPLDALCSKNSAYVISGETIITVAHELGHMFGSPHTHNCAWPAGPGGTLAPIDQCASVEGDCGFDGIIRQEGTIMSYCPTMTETFGPLVRSFIRARTEANPCIGNGMELTNMLSGKVTLNNKGLAGVKISADRNHGEGPIITTTNEDGTYTLSLYNDSYTIQANKDSFYINPISLISTTFPVIIAGVDVTGVDFQAIELIADSFEPDGSINEASLIPTDGTIQHHTIHELWNVDYFQFNAISGKTYSIMVHQERGNTFPIITLFDSDGVTQIKNSFIPPVIEWKADRDGTFYVKVSGNKGFYGISVSTDFSTAETNVIPLTYTASDWGDFDGDGDLDLLVAGNNANWSFEIDLYKNDNGLLIKTQAGFDQISTTNFISNSVLKWVDFDNDGDLDAFISIEYSAFFYINDGGAFNSKVIIDENLDGRFAAICSVAIGDYDNDGDLDILIQSHTDVNYIGDYPLLRLYRNDQGSFVNTHLNLRGADFGKVIWADYDGDDDLDIMIVGSSGRNGDANSGSSDNYPFTMIYRNDNGNYINSNIIINPLSSYPNVAFGDYDNDGDLDLAIAGVDSSKFVAKIYQNNNGTLTDMNAALKGSRNAHIAWGDYDNDGDLDLVIVGQEKSSAVSSALTSLYINYKGIFEEAPFNLMLPSVVGNVNWADYDGDSDLDLFLIGEGTGGKVHASLLQNETENKNAPPSAPSGTNAMVDKNTVTLSWDTAQDDHTDTKGLSYNIRLSKTPGGMDVISPMADVNTGKRQIVEMGNAGDLLYHTYYNLPPNTYYWSVQAIDNSFMGGKFAPEGSFKVLPTSITSPDQLISLKVYPNPATNEFNIEFTGNTRETDLEIINSIGQAVYTGNIIEKKVVSTKHFIPGLYVIKIKNGDKIEFKKIQKV